MRIRVVLILLTLGVALAPSAALAQPSRQDERRRLMERATEARIAGNHGEAVMLAAQAERIQASPSLLLFIAEEQQTLGDLVEAHRAAQNCLGLTANTPGVNNREVILQRCTEIRDAAERVTARVELAIGESVPRTATVTVAGRVIDAGSWTVPQRVRPGEVVVEAQAEGHRRFRELIHVPAGVTWRVEVSLVDETTAAVTTSTPPGSSNAGGSGPTERSPEPRAPAVEPWVFMGTGATVALVGMGFLLYGHALVEERDGMSTTFAEYDALSSEIGTWKMVGNVMVGAGVAAAVSGLVWFLRDRAHRRADRGRAWNWSVHPLAGGAVVGVGGAL